MKKICIGVGHGGRDPGAVNGQRHEADDNLRISLEIAKILKEYGHEVVLTRETDKAMSPEERRLAAINIKSDFFIDMHRNSHVDSGAKGVEIWVRTAENIKPAERLLAEIAKVGKQTMRGVKIGSYAVLFNMPMPAMLLELGFISNEADNKIYDELFLENAKAVAAGIMLALGEDIPEKEKPADKFYRVQLGAFKNKEYAEKMRDQLVFMGYEAFITE